MILIKLNYNTKKINPGEKMIKRKMFCLILMMLITMCGCDEEATVNETINNSTNSYKTIRYFAFVTPTDNAQVTKTFTYTNDAGGTTQKTSGNGNFEKVLQIKSGTFIELSASGTTTTNLVISCRAIIYVDGVNMAQSHATSKPNENSVSVSIIVP
jgi:hypothetical protein